MWMRYVNAPAMLWKKMSIRPKLFLFFTLWALGMASLLGFSFFYNSRFENESAVYLDDYYNTNGFIRHVIRVQTLLETILREPDEPALREELAQVSRVLEWELSRFPRGYDTKAIEKSLLAQGTRNLHESYLKGAALLLKQVDVGAMTSAVQSFYGKVLPPLEFMQSYAQQMMNVSLSEGQIFYAERRVEGERTRRLVFLTALLLLACGSLMGVAVIRSIVTPILELSNASREIAAGSFDAPDVEPETRDEVYELARSFNSMKHSMRALVADLRDKNELERQLYHQTTQNLQTQKLLEQAKMAQLRSQIKPHFLFNTLNIISRTARVEQAPKTESLIKALARLLRYVLKTDAQIVVLAREIELADEYMMIQRTRFGERVSLRWRRQQGLEEDRLQIPAFILQPLIENAIIHGLEPKVEGGVIRIRMHLHGTRLHIIISDSGQGMAPERIAYLSGQAGYQGDISGIGVNNVAERVRLMHPDNHFEIRSKQGLGTCIRIIICQEGEPYAKNTGRG